MAFVIELGGCFGDLDGFSCIGQLHGFGSAVQHRTVRRFYFSDRIFTEVQRLACGIAFFICCNGICCRSLCITERAVRRYNILGGGNLVNRTRKTLVCKYKAVYAVCFRNRRKNFTAFREFNNTFLRHITLFNGYYRFTAVNFKCHRFSVQHIPICRAFLCNFVITVGQLFGQHKFACKIRIIGIYIRRRRVGYMPHHKVARIGISYLKAYTRRRDYFPCFRVLFYYLYR